MKRLMATALRPLVALADAAPFGPEMGVATVDDAKGRAVLEHVGPNRHGHLHYRLNPSDFDIERFTWDSAFFGAGKGMTGRRLAHDLPANGWRGYGENARNRRK